MLKFHKEKNAKATIAVIEVPWDEASRFGIMNTTDEGKIYEFEEKPENPKSNLASMGVYIFNWSILRDYFIKSEKSNKCFDDFGKDIIPMMLEDEREMYAYSFKGYWRDVGTIQSLWDANMDLIKYPHAIDLNDSKWRIYTNTMANPPQYIGKNAQINESLIADGCAILGEVENSVLSHGVYIDENSSVKDSVIMPNVKIGKNVTIEKAMIGEGAVIEDNSVITNNDEISVISEYEVVKAELALQGGR
jgi:glucose-1-phosphate adenylyltransferase